MAETAGNLRCVIVTPETTVFDRPVDFVAVPLYDGELGILPGRAPLVGRLGYGELRARAGGVVARFYIDGGFVQVEGDVVSVLTPRALPAERIDPAAAHAELEAARQQTPTTPEALQAKETAILRARGQTAVARKAARTADPSRLN